MDRAPAKIMIGGTISSLQAEEIIRICLEREGIDGPTYFYDNCENEVRLTDVQHLEKAMLGKCESWRWRKPQLTNAQQLEEAKAVFETNPILYNDEAEGGYFSDLEAYLFEEGIAYRRQTNTEYADIVEVFDPNQNPKPVSFFLDGPHALTRMSYCHDALDHLRNGNIKDAIEYLELAVSTHMAPIPPFKIQD